MSKLNRYRVLREHDGDRRYAEGETRTANAHDVAHLIPKVLELIGPAEEPVAEKADTERQTKVEAIHLNKAEQAKPTRKRTAE